MNKLSPAKYFKTLTIFHMSLVFSQLVFIVVALYLRSEGYVTMNSEELDFIKYLVPVLVAGGLIEGNVFYKQKVKAARKKTTMAKKLGDYRLGLIVRYALWEAPSLFAIAAYVMTGNWIYLALSALVVISFLANRPNMNKARKELEL